MHWNAAHLFKGFGKLEFAQKGSNDLGRGQANWPRRRDGRGQNRHGHTPHAHGSPLRKLTRHCQ
jgi:hypothetical protein